MGGEVDVVVLIVGEFEGEVPCVDSVGVALGPDGECEADADRFSVGLGTYG